jgi:hypothetical protein
MLYKNKNRNELEIHTTSMSRHMMLNGCLILFFGTLDERRMRKPEKKVLWHLPILKLGLIFLFLLFLGGTVSM